MPYVVEKPPIATPVEELRAWIPGWGVDLDPADRPSVPRERLVEDRTGAHWHFPDRQPEKWPRERSIEHAMLTPVFGTSCPPKGLSGVIRKYAYAKYSEGRAAHWLLLLLGDRVDVWESHLASFATLHPDNPFTESGVRSELTRGGFSSRFGSKRADTNHQWMDPIIVVGPWVLSGWAAYRVVRRLRSRR